LKLLVVAHYRNHTVYSIFVSNTYVVLDFHMKVMVCVFSRIGTLVYPRKFRGKTGLRTERHLRPIPRICCPPTRFCMDMGEGWGYLRRIPNNSVKDFSFEYRYTVLYGLFRMMIRYNFTHGKLCQKNWG
jgi:hypothetical protein